MTQKTIDTVFEKIEAIRTQKEVIEYTENEAIRAVDNYNEYVKENTDKTDEELKDGWRYDEIKRTQQKVNTAKWVLELMLKDLAKEIGK